jgi:uncharacterized protein YecT (DUF1311 family)
MLGCFICALCFTGISVFGQEKTDEKLDERFKACLDKDTSACNIYNCAFEAYAEWDKIMDREYKRLLKNLKNNKDKNALKSTQSTWVTYRDNEFKAYDNMFNRPGTFWVRQRATGRVDIVRTRALQLQQYNEALEQKHRR